MERNWYLLCTKKQQEKKVTELLTKKGFENYCPFTNKERNISASKKVTERQPLFSSYVFVHITEAEIGSVKNIPDVINTVYWKSNPVIVHQEEINTIKMMADSYNSIQLEKTIVGVTEKITVMEENSSNYDNSVLTIKHKGLSVTLPSLGYRMIAKRENVITKAAGKEVATSGSFLKRINMLFFFGF